jgi:DNA polymerase-3 subunit delta'
MNHEAANAFLKTLEEPQEQTIFILTTDRISAIPPTIRSRCQMVRFSAIDTDLIIEYLKKNMNISEPDAQLASALAEGSLRKALDFIRNKEDFLPKPELIEIIDQSKTSPLESLNNLFAKDREPQTPETMIGELLFIYRNALRGKLVLPNYYKHDIIQKITASLNQEEIANRVSFLLNALNDTRLYLNKKLFLYSVFSHTRI